MFAMIHGRYLRYQEIPSAIIEQEQGVIEGCVIENKKNGTGLGMSTLLLRELRYAYALFSLIQEQQYLPFIIVYLQTQSLKYIYINVSLALIHTAF